MIFSTLHVLDHELIDHVMPGHIVDNADLKSMGSAVVPLLVSTAGQTNSGSAGGNVYIARNSQLCLPQFSATWTQHNNSYIEYNTDNVSHRIRQLLIASGLRSHANSCCCWVVVPSL